MNKQNWHMKTIFLFISIHVFKTERILYFKFRQTYPTLKIHKWLALNFFKNFAAGWET